MATTIRNQKLFCTNCGGEFALEYPIAAKEMAAKTTAFDALHKSCKQTWKEPEADQSKTVNEKALWWIANGRVGMSSKTMWQCFMGQEIKEVYHPWDPDDFSRCYALLETVPEWKKELHKLKALSPVWGRLVGNWDKLNEYFEDMLIVKKGNGMYEFMEKIIDYKNKTAP